MVRDTSNYQRDKSTKTSMCVVRRFSGFALAVALVFLSWEQSSFARVGIVSSSSSTTGAKAICDHVSSLSNPMLEQDILKIQDRLSCLDPKGPQPIILFTSGRSGSTAIWQIMGNLTGRTTIAQEIPGVKGVQMLSFLDEHESNDQYPGQWMVNILCEKQKQFPDAGVVGFKWKPFGPALAKKSAKAALRLIGDASKAFSHSPPIKVVRSRRNVLDFFISAEKHRADLAKNLGNKTVPNHCIVGDQECIDKAVAASSGMTLNTTQLLSFLSAKVTQGEETDQVLENMQVPLLQVEYERLFYNYYAHQEWQQVFAFIGRGPTTNLTLRKLEKAMGFAPTHAFPTQKETLSNFEEVAALLEGTEFEHLLH